MGWAGSQFWSSWDGMEASFVRDRIGWKPVLFGLGWAGSQFCSGWDELEASFVRASSNFTESSRNAYDDNSISGKSREQLLFNRITQQAQNPVP